MEKEIYNIKFAELIKKSKKRNVDIAKETDMQETTISSFKTNRYKEANIEEAKKLAKSLNITFKEIKNIINVSGTTNENNTPENTWEELWQLVKYRFTCTEIIKPLTVIKAEIEKKYSVGEAYETIQEFKRRREQNEALRNTKKIFPEDKINIDNLTLFLDTARNRIKKIKDNKSF